jgi:hypothetical protein
VAEVPKACARWIVRRLRFLFKTKKLFSPYSTRVVASGPLNSDLCWMTCDVWSLDF